MKSSLFDSEFFKDNRRRLRRLVDDSEPIVLVANGLLQRNSDSSYPFRQDSNFWYMTGLNKPDIILVMDGDEEFLIAPLREHARAVFDGNIDPVVLAEQSGVKTVLGETDGYKKLDILIRKKTQIATLTPPPAFIVQYGIYTNPARANLISRLQESHHGLELADIRQHLAVMRSIKQPEELEAINKAISITAEALEQVHNNLGKYKYENEVDAGISAHFRRLGAGHAYQPIIASGANACTLHYIDNSAPIDKNGLLLIDVGAEVENYAADITRTFALEEPTKRQKQVIQSVEDVQAFCLSRLKPGVILKDYEQAVEKYMGEKLRELGLIKEISHEEVRKYYPHSTSHFLGLDVHDMADYEAPLAEGMVLTVEPGIYIAGEGLGVRTEDNVLITAKGVQVLSGSIPKY